MGEEGDYIYIYIMREYDYRYTVTTSMTPALRWAAMKEHFKISLIVREQCHKTVSTDQNFEEKGELKWI